MANHAATEINTARESAKLRLAQHLDGITILAAYRRRSVPLRAASTLPAVFKVIGLPSEHQCLSKGSSHVNLVASITRG